MLLICQSRVPKIKDSCSRVFTRVSSNCCAQANPQHKVV